VKPWSVTSRRAARAPSRSKRASARRARVSDVGRWGRARLRAVLASGIRKGVSSLEPWLTSSERFPEHFIETVHKAFAAARKRCARSALGPRRPEPPRESR
jgi:hypothetical protein